MNEALKFLAERLIFVLTFLVLLLWSIIKLPFPTPRKSIAGQIALVTGAGQGLGREIALVLAENGCKLVIVDLNESNAEKTANEVTTRTGMPARAYKCDVSDWNAVTALYEQVTKEVGVVDILVNNAGLILFQLFLDNSQRDIQKLINVNVGGVIWMTKVFLKDMLTQKRGHIVTISSAQALYAVPWSIVYAATKAASHSFTVSLSDQLRLEGLDDYVKTSSVLPYIFKTPLTEKMSYAFPLLDIRETATIIVDGLLKNKHEIFIPRSWIVILKIFFLCPLANKYLIRDAIVKENYHYSNANSMINSVYDDKKDK